MPTKVVKINQNWVLVNTAGQTQLCNFADNYYGDQQCYLVQTNTSDKNKSAAR
ncbi:hypothetical protein [Glaciecola sp. 1036]|uniref:hypothetical protein n=1 Tax=Alteromonadaceae TaxID=72275 RepID=UPI003D053455